MEIKSLKTVVKVSFNLLLSYSKIVILFYFSFHQNLKESVALILRIHVFYNSLSIDSFCFGFTINACTDNVVEMATNLCS